MSRSRRRVTWTAVRTGIVLGVVVVGCNAILDNEPGQLGQSNSPALPGDDAGDDPGEAPDAGSAAQDDAGSDEDAGNTTIPCAPSKHLCHGACVANSDPAYGCGAQDCKPCAPAHATATCKGSTCAIKTCFEGWADCNKAARDGCETSLTTPDNCGQCDRECKNGAVCGPSGRTYACSAACPPTAPVRCSGECVNPLTDPGHCGGCGTACPVPPNGRATCIGGVCLADCAAGTHLCAGACVPDADPTACGPLCVPCPIAGPHARSTCAAGVCALECEAGFADCNADPTDGCEVDIASDTGNCGICRSTCVGLCIGGICIGATLDAGRDGGR